MSDYERNKGKLVPFKLTEEVAKELVFQAQGNYNLCDYCDTYFDQVEDDSESYGLAVVKRKFYKVEWEIRRGDFEEFAEVSESEDGVISFHTYHYNGGAHWSEVVENALKKGEEDEV